MDIDLMGRIDNSLEHIRVVVEEICRLAVEQDGVEFREETIEIQRIKEDAEYEGARVRLTATVAKARLVVQIDIGFGDSIVPRPTKIEYPVLLEFPVPKLLAYPRETVVAEKLEAITVLGVLVSVGAFVAVLLGSMLVLSNRSKTRPRCGTSMTNP